MMIWTSRWKNCRTVHSQTHLITTLGYRALCVFRAVFALTLKKAAIYRPLAHFFWPLMRGKTGSFASPEGPSPLDFV